MPRVKTLAVIPARLGATRLPRKPLRLLAGVPIVVRVMERVAALRVADRIVVATDSEEIAQRAPNKEQPLLLHCLSGGRSGIARGQVRSLGDDLGFLFMEACVQYRVRYFFLFQHFLLKRIH